MSCINKEIIAGKRSPPCQEPKSNVNPLSRDSPLSTSVALGTGADQGLLSEVPSLTDLMSLLQPSPAVQSSAVAAAAAVSPAANPSPNTHVKTGTSFHLDFNMQWVNKAVQYYRDANPSTLSGAIDVIVVERKLDSGETELACSPFHVRFGKLNVLRAVDKKVTIHINGAPIPYDMKITESGEGFFVFETEGDVPESMQTSPLASPVDSKEEPDFFDLDGGSHPKAPEDLASALSNGLETLSISDLGPSSKLVAPDSSLPAPGASPPDKASGISTTEEAALGTTDPRPPPRGKNLEEEYTDRVRQGNEEQFIHDMVEELRETNPEQQGGVMLDASGYKSKEDKSHRPTAEDAALAEDVRQFALALLASTDEKTLRSVLDPSDRAASPISPTLTPQADSDASLPALSPEASPTMTPIDMLNDLQQTQRASHAPDLSRGYLHAASRTDLGIFRLTMDRVDYDFALSECGARAPDSPDAAARFDEHRIDFATFIKGDIDIDTVVRYRGRYLTYYNAYVVLFALAVYRVSLIEHPAFHHRQDGDLTLSEPSSRRETLTTSSSKWSSWWSRGRTTPGSTPVSTPGATSATSGNVGASATPDSTPGNPASRTFPPDPDDSHAEDTLDTSFRTAQDESASDAPNESVSTLPAKSFSTDSVAAELFTKDSKHYAKTLRLTSDQLKSLKLKKGLNTIEFSVRSGYSGLATCTSRIFLWESEHSVVISDIDGTITKSDALGHVLNMIGRDWTHSGVAKLYTDIVKNGYHIMYLTSRAIGQADTTRDYLRGINQDGYTLPEGPVIMSPDRLMTSLRREVILRQPEVFKMACLRDIQRLFGEGKKPFFAGFGNRITDAISYRSVDVPSKRIFTIDSNSDIKFELLEIAGYKSTYIGMSDLIYQIFPPIDHMLQAEYVDYNYWKAPIPELDELPADLFPSSPASPALSARSDSGLSLPRRIGSSLANSLSRRSSKQTLDAGGIQRPSSPLLNEVFAEEPAALEESEALDLRNRSSSMSSSHTGSMPGSLDRNEFDFEDYYNDNKQGKNGVRDGETEASTGQKDPEEETFTDDENEEDEGEGEDFKDQFDFSSVPYI